MSNFSSTIVVQRSLTCQYLYRTYRGENVPVMGDPHYLGLVEKVRGADSWVVWARPSPEVMAHALAILSGGRPAYVAVQEVKQGRTRWAASISVQTTDPAEE